MQISISYAQQKSDSKTLYTQGEMAYQMLQIPSIKTGKSRRPIVIAVVDNGFSFTHKDLQGRCFINPGEIRNNGKDDDGNGLVDDVFGWDFGDNDNDVAPPTLRDSLSLTHGTMIAGIIAQTFYRCYGVGTDNFVILPIKILSDQASKANYENAYIGIDYAVKMNADIICLPWSGGKYNSENDKYFNEAARKGILIFGSAGNAYSEPVQPPATQKAVQAIAAVDTNWMRLPSSSYGTKVAWSACGQNVLAPYAYGDNIYTFCEKTSAAVALVAGCAAVLKAQNPDESNANILLALSATARSVDAENPRYIGKLGSGVPNVTEAIKFLNSADKASYFNGQNAGGNIFIDKHTQSKEWKIAPRHAVASFQFELQGDARKLNNSYLNFFEENGKLQRVKLSEYPQQVVIKSPSVTVKYEGALPKSEIVLQYMATMVDSGKLFCSGITNIEADSGEISDGSGAQDYTFNNNCKWLINVSKGKNIRIDFLEFDTEEERDNLLIFKGDKALQESAMARFSGTQIPPSLVIAGNQVLLWFLTNDTIQKQGWRIKFRAVDDPPGVVNSNSVK